MWFWNNKKIKNEIRITEEIIEVKNKISRLNALLLILTENRTEDFKIRICYSNEWENLEIRNDIFCKALKEEVEYRRNILKEKMYQLKETFDKNEVEDEE